MVSTPAWLLLIRLQQTRVSDDVFSRPLAELKGTRKENREVQVSDQARIIELLQMLMYAYGINKDQPVKTPRLTLLLTCWDEMAAASEPPVVMLRQQLPMFCDFVTSNWARPNVLGLSALERPLNP